jgi:hypothetical protein
MAACLIFKRPLKVIFKLSAGVQMQNRLRSRANLQSAARFA